MYILNKESYKTFKWLQSNLQKVDKKKPPKGYYEERIYGLSNLCVLDEGTTFIAASQYFAVMANYLDVTRIAVLSEDDDIGSANFTEPLKDGFYSLTIKKGKVFVEPVIDSPFFPTFTINTKDYKRKGDTEHLFNGTFLDTIISPFNEVKMRFTHKSGAAFPIIIELGKADGFLTGKYYGFLMPRVNFYPERDIVNELLPNTYIEKVSEKVPIKMYSKRKHLTKQ